MAAATARPIARPALGPGPGALAADISDDDPVATMGGSSGVEETAEEKLAERAAGARGCAPRTAARTAATICAQRRRRGFKNAQRARASEPPLLPTRAPAPHSPSRPR